MAKEGVLLHQRGSHPQQDTAAYMKMFNATGEPQGFPAGLQLLLQRGPGLLQVLCHIQLCMNNSDRRTINPQVRSLRDSGICHYHNQ